MDWNGDGPHPTEFPPLLVVPLGAAQQGHDWRRARPDDVEAMTIRTCARHEVVAVGLDLSALYSWAGRRVGWDGVGTAASGRSAWRRLSRLAAGLESPIVGEPEIAEQLRAALARSVHSGTGGARLSSSVGWALGAGQRARQKAGFERHPVGIGPSVAAAVGRHAAVQARDVVTITVVGAGHCARAVTLALVAQGRPPAMIVNRAGERASLLASRCGARFIPLESVSAAARMSHVAIVCAPLRTGTDGSAEQCLDGPSLVIDLRSDDGPTLVPATSEQEIISLRDVHDAEQRRRPSLEWAIAIAEASIETDLDHFAGRERTAGVERALAALYRDMPAVIATVTDAAMAVGTRSHVERAVRSALRTTFHHHATRLRGREPGWDGVRDGVRDGS